MRQLLRSLSRPRGFVAWTVGSLALGMAVAIAALAFLNASLLRPFPGVTRQDRLVRVSVATECGRPDCRRLLASPEDYTGLRESLLGLQGLSAYAQGEVVAGLPDAQSIHGAVVSANYFEVLGVHPILGRSFRREDETAQAAVAVIGSELWARAFDSDPTAIGRSIRVADTFVEIVGVAPEAFDGIDSGRRSQQRAEIWLPLWLSERAMPRGGESRAQPRNLYFFGRLRDGVTAREVEAQAIVVAARLTAARTETAQSPAAEVTRLWRVRPENWQFALIIVLPIPILVLAIACVNAANLMLARGAERQREIAIRLAIGAGRWRIVRLLMAESVLLAIVATAVAAPLAAVGLHFASTPLNTPIPLDPTVIVFTIATAMITTLAFGLLPALRVSTLRPSQTLTPSGAHGNSQPRQSRLQRVLVGAQVAISLGLLSTGWQLISTVRSQSVSAGTPAGRLLMAQFDLRPLATSALENDRFYRQLVDGAKRLTGVESAGLSRAASVWTFGQNAGSASVLVWRPGELPAQARATAGGYAGGDLFAAVGLLTTSGRAFTDDDRRAVPEVAIVNEPFARSLDRPALGSIVYVAARSSAVATATEVRIVGVIEAADEPRLAERQSAAPRIYLPSPLEHEPALTLYVRSQGQATALAPAVRALVTRIAPRVPIRAIGSLGDFNERSFGPQLWMARAARFLGLIGLLLATAGLYAVSSHAVTRRAREIAIRMAIGARPGEILVMVLSQSMRTAFVGLLVGGSAAIAATRIIQSGYHGILGLDGTAFAGAAFLFLAAMLMASALPAIRAARVDPIENLKDA